jgi:hypothetical protein
LAFSYWLLAKYFKKEYFKGYWLLAIGFWQSIKKKEYVIQKIKKANSPKLIAKSQQLKAKKLCETTKNILFGRKGIN